MSNKKKITHEELARAIFIDYEGNIDRPPTLLGWRMDGRSHGAILEEAFRTCSDRYRVKGIEWQSHRQVATRLLQQACEEDRVLVSWSEHDLRLLQAVLPKQDHTHLLAHYRNAIPAAKAWHLRSLQSRAPQREMAYFCQLLGFPVPSRYGPGKVGQGLRLLRGQLQEGRTYPELTPKARASWVAVVKHNDLDLRALEFVLRAMLEVPIGCSHPGQMALTFVLPRA